MNIAILKAELERINELNGVDINDVEMLRKKLKEVQRTRHLMVWLDNSTVANSGYLVCLITCLYDAAVFYTDDEYQAQFGMSVNIQQIIEEPELHFIARCGSSDSELLLYTEDRLKCISELKTTSCTEEVRNINYTDKMRFCHGDMPLKAFESGQHKGGNYFCSACGIHCEETFCLDHALNCSFASLQKRQEAILKGTVAKRKLHEGKVKPFVNLSKQDIMEELGSREVYDGKTLKELQNLLTENLHGQQRVPALLIHTPEASLTDFGLENYEVLPCEPLHDIGHHIENFITEFPIHLSPQESKLFTEAASISL